MKLPKPVKRPSGRWHCSVMVSGKRISITADTKKQCEERAFEIKMLHRRDRDTNHITLDEAIDLYIDAHINVLSPSTIRGYKYIQRGRFKSVVDAEISSVRDWQSVVNTEALLCSPKTLKNAWGFIKSVLRSQGFEPPNVQLPQIVSKEMAYLDPDDISVFLKAINGHKYEIHYLIGLHGLRQSEMFAIREIKDGIIKVRGSVVKDVHEKYVYKITNKTTNSRRDVPVCIPRLQELLDKGIEICKVSPEALRRGLMKICLENDLPVVSFHGLRHSFASLAFSLGLSETETMRLGGWSNPATMRKIYVHLSERQADKAAAKIKDFYEKLSCNLDVI